ncbi:MAG: putative nucleotidyltransferase substrate binding domain-containing protein [Gammaproteobacteria bacterium]
MTGILDLAAPPFDALSAPERRRLREAIGVASFAAGDLVKERDERWESLFVVLRGLIEGRDEAGERIRQFGPDELVSARDLVRGDRTRRFVAVEPTSCVVIPRQVLDPLVRRNTPFRLALAEDQPSITPMPRGAPSDADAFTLARVGDALIRKPVIAGPEKDLAFGVEVVMDRKADCLLVRRGDDIGIVTGTDLLGALADGSGTDRALAEVASWDLITVSPDDFLFDALVKMTRHNIERVVVKSDDGVEGILELTDVLGLFSTQSHSLAIRIERAESIEELAAASAAMTDLTRNLVDRGVDIALVLDLLSALNARTMARLYRMCVPEEAMDRSCLVVMGSEGRGEQILKTDQDNALIVADDFDWPEVNQAMAKFSEELGKLGYPPCPGGFMVSNPDWVMTASQWREKLEGWIRSADGDAMLNLTVVSDFHPVAGRRALFDDLQAWLLERFHAGIGFISTFARPVLQFSVPLNFFGQIRNPDEGIDIKKGGIFPLVHGVRTMALDGRITETNTFRRIRHLVARGVLDARTGDELAHALELFMVVRLRQQLEAIGAGREPGNVVRPAGLNRREREQLRRALRVVKGFQSTLSRRYHLEI